MKGGGYGFSGNIIIGSLVGGWLFDVLNISVGAGLVGQLIKGVSGVAVIDGIFKTW